MSHVSHREPGVAGLLGMQIHDIAIDLDTMRVDVAALRAQARELRPAGKHKHSCVCVGYQISTHFGVSTSNGCRQHS